MVDFKKLREAKAAVAPTVPREIFNQLPRPDGINDLYVSQDEALQQWHIRRADRDVVLKLHTGGGKSLVGLLIAQSVMNKKRSPFSISRQQFSSLIRSSKRQQNMASTLLHM